MKNYIIATCLLFASSFTYSQWINLGNQGMDVQMIENAHGVRFINTSGPTPATGITYKVYSTPDDWQNETAVSAGGGGNYGCCPVSGMDFLDTSTGLRSIGFQGIYSLSKTVDGGQNWTAFASSLNFLPGSLVMVHDTTGYFSGLSYGTGNGQLFRLTPGSSQLLQDWDTLVFVDTPLEFVSPHLGFAVMEDTNQHSHVVKTNDWGITWNKVLSDNLSSLTCISFPDSMTGYVGTSTGNLHKTTDGGANWTVLSGPANLRINAIDFYDGLVGYIACDSGKVYRTTDGGLSWVGQPTGMSAAVMDVQMVDSITVYCTDADGVLLKQGTPLAADFATSEALEQVSISPNPSSEHILIAVPAGSRLSSVRIYNLRGTLVYAGSATHIDISDWQSGLYFVQVGLGLSSQVTKFLKI